MMLDGRMFCFKSAATTRQLLEVLLKEIDKGMKGIKKWRERWKG
jgi:hypothetical protein